MNLLAIETATEACSVALWCDGVLRERFEVAPRRHTELVLPWADALLAEAGIAKTQIDVIACGRGPGAFTGVRLTVALTQGLALALDRPVVAVSTLAALAFAANAAPGEAVLAAIDARMGEVYLAAFEREPEDVRLLGSEHLLRPVAASPDPSRRWIGVGTGFDAEQGALRTALGSTVARVDAAALPHAAAVARLAVQAYARGEIVAPERLEPAYLRDKVALTLAEQGKPRPS
ncbi:MAG: tRNA (adenosine(37)-N6)-threonylcarbamoyltransferase complex dimerization subunit type 1 TsaB [Chiayiivirga sp.]|jgi:tRNA threonylcarbamoyladenosine biosynthesis protein TsaB|uniref:tRNA (adenosine(37)-N6)-threonylcarbamoyltransferase complex dimerization subunit type 1 TsaB n=1 Tax=Chiayiivirga sp. TaxID=2041042 RepID=UPI0025B8C6AE|nr:tRNA (adenosine(37)-N6)-threonylcarbamoyltransferase complex dimerization subunit type 1 TsaB [Chiayiivirga sp.]MCI1729362.1 tRNA (adenosine(37)-N6)-threonylcarbamoyltransferase complex dimerization subunit type 1 TsaB [Chiayiivirga sp.]